LVLEDKPKALRKQLDGRIVELRGEPLKELRQIALSLEMVEGVQAFGDRLHIRIRRGYSEDVITKLRDSQNSSEVVIDKIEMIPPSLEDVFIALLENQNENQ
jgi:hypothetical protein